MSKRSTLLILLGVVSGLLLAFGLWLALGDGALVLDSLLARLAGPGVLEDPSGASLTVVSPDEDYVFTGDPVQLAWFYKPPQDGNLALVAEKYDTFILTKNDEGERDTLRALGVTTPFLQYVRFDAIMDPGDCEAQPWRNQVADQIGDYCWIAQQHPDWFLLDADGNLLVDSEGFVLMDPGNAGWRAFWLERTRANQEQLGWDGVFLDNVEASLEKFTRRGAYPALYPDDASYQAAVEGFLAYLSTNYFQPAGRPLWANIIELEDTDTWFRYMQHLDGAMIEAWAADWSSGYLSTRAWEQHLYLAEQTQALGKQVLLVTQGQQDNLSRQQFAFGSYLLVMDGGASFRYGRANHHDEIWLYDNYELDLGVPLGPRYQDGDLWRRDFSNGMVIVDPEAHSAIISLE